MHVEPPHKKSMTANLSKGSEWSCVQSNSSLVHCDSLSSTGDLTVYSGISIRSRGWKDTRFGDFMEGRIPPNANIKRWDGAARACAAWDNLRRDPELWFDSGNCFIHLYGKGQSRRGPAFKVPLAPLLEANCHPLLNRYLARDVPESTRPGSAYGSSKGAKTAGKIDLYIPPPPRADKKQALDFQLAMRNLFAWVYRRPMVGQQLGSALIGLMDSMREFRSPGTDGVEDIVKYAEQQGYLNMANQPIHALAILHFAEYFQLKDLYINAFAHCSGMGDCLYTLPEYQAVSSITRRFLRRAQSEVENKLSKAGMALRNFLEEDLSEANLGLSVGGRAHLERFRTFLLAFYTHQLGYYPPSPMHTRSIMWHPEIYRSMRDDFEALYEFLADESFATSDSGSFLGQGGSCTLQRVHNFDLRHKYTPLPHPLPLLPEVTASTTSKRMSWFGKGDSKLRPDKRLLTHAALVKATNSGRPHLTGNSLVSAYKRFEEDSLCSQLKFDKIEKLTQVEARKIRWMLIYGVYQTLRNCTDAPPEVRDTDSAQYSLSISTNDLPPWKESRRLPVRRTRSHMGGVSPSTSVRSSRTSPPASSCEKRPDVAAGSASTSRDNSLRVKRQSVALSPTPPPIPIPPRSGSLWQSFAMVGSLGKSSERTAPAIGPAGPRRSVMYREIVVQGYGNGTNQETIESQKPRSSGGVSTLAKSPSTASNSSAESGTTSSAESGTNSSDTSPRSEGSWSAGETSIPDGPPTTRRPSVESVRSGSSSVYSTPEEACPPLPRRSSARKSLVLMFEDEDGTPAPLRVRKEAALPDDAEAWVAIEGDVNQRCEAVPAGRPARADSVGDGERPEW